MKKKNYVKVKSQNNLVTATEEIPEKCLNAHDLQRCRNLLEQDDEKYTDVEIEIIYNFLKEMAEIAKVAIFKPRNNEKSNFNGAGEF